MRARGIPKRSGDAGAPGGADLDAAAGQIHRVAGPDGAGKTTLLGLLRGLTVAAPGTLGVLGTPAARRASVARGHRLAAPDGPGDNRRCHVHWHLPDASNATGQAICQLDVNANGRYIADGRAAGSERLLRGAHPLPGRTEPAMAVRRPRRPAGQHAEGITNKCR